jgi:FkbM family methyltransferase
MPGHSVGRLRERLTHYSCDSYTQYLPKIERYAIVQARLWQTQGRQARLRQLLLRFPFRFLQGYIWRLGFLDGLAGVQVCMLVAYASWLKQAYLWQLQRGRDWRPDDRKTFSVSPVSRAPDSESADAVPLVSLSEPSPTLQRRTFRELRHRLTPNWLTTNARRQRRNMFFRWLGIQRCYTPPIVTREPSMVMRSCLPFVVGHELLNNPRLTFLQIGAYDGVGDDDLRGLVLMHKLRGVLLEPQPAAFARLQRTYRNQPNVTLLEAAIAEQAGMRELYCKRGEASMAASFDREHLRRHGIADSDIVTQTVVCHTVESALATAGLAQVDLIQIDAEGYDWPIIRSINFERLQPKILRFEYRNMPPQDADACLALLASHDYRFIMESRDIIAYQSAELMATLAPPQRRSA